MDIPSNQKICGFCGVSFPKPKQSVSELYWQTKRRFCSKACKFAAQLGVPLPKGTQTTEERFWKHVQKSEDGCWLWMGHRNKKSQYGIFGVGSRTDGTRRVVLAHRFIYELKHGKLPGPHIKVCHTCDNHPCVRDDHFFVGTQADNIADMITKGRDRKLSGEHHPCAKITASDAENIRLIYAAGGVTQTVLAARFGLTQGHINNILRHRVWR